MPNVETLLKDHVTLKIDCVDRLYLNGYVPRFQRPQNVWWFFHEHRGCPVLSPVLLKKMGEAFVEGIRSFADRHHIPVIHFRPGERKEDVAQKRLSRFKRKEGVLFIGVAQEKVTGFRAYDKARAPRRPRASGKAPCFAFYRGSIHVNQYYFYILDREFGLCFIKFSSYAPFNIRVWLNGHEWAKRQLDRRKIRFEPLENGFLSCSDPEALQKICDSFCASDIESFFRRWLARLPHPFSREDRRVGFRYQLSILQMEVSRTQVFDRPLRGREFFEEVIRDNLDIGRPDRVQLLFERRISRRTPGSFRTRVITAGVQPSLRFDYKHTRVKQYFKGERALRTETTFNDTYDFGVGRSLCNLERMKVLGRNFNQRLLALERVAHHCAVSTPTVERIVLPTIEAGQRAPALRWGDPRTMALFAAICAFATCANGFTNAELRDQVRRLHDPGPSGYGAGRMSYDLRRLRLKGLIQRVPRSHRYLLTPLGRRVALFVTKSFARIVRPTLQRLDPVLPEDAQDHLQQAWRAYEAAIDEVLSDARMAA